MALSDATLRLLRRALGRRTANALAAEVGGGLETVEWNLTTTEFHDGGTFWANQDDTIRVVRHGRHVVIQVAMGRDLDTPFEDWEPVNPNTPLPAEFIPPSWVDQAIVWDAREDNRHDVPGRAEIFDDGIIYAKLSEDPGVGPTYITVQFAISYLVI